MKSVTITDANRIIIQALGLDPHRYDCGTVEVLAALLRRAASFQCPCSARALVQSVAETLQGLVTIDDLPDTIDRVLDKLLAYGDLTEVKATEKGAAVYTAPPTFVTLASGRTLVLGVCPESVDWLPASIRAKLAYNGHVRSFSRGDGSVGSLLRDAGYYELPHKLWLQAPKSVPAEQVYERYIARQQDTGRLVEPTGITILDQSRPVGFYKGRWRPAAGTGRFVARREQRYGAPLWSFLTLKDGHMTSLVDLPVEGTVLRACDEAWWLQAAIDAYNGTPQYAELLAVSGSDNVRLRFFGPLPRWAQRQLDVIGAPEQVKGALFSYNIPKADLEFIRDFLAQHLWMTVVAVTGENAAS
ncbi:MAG: hypothetical protein JST16_00140 [Bdellovibrionales bacterium]|nr:hypothetical protein [Bdellovibrionales bacterium]